MRCHRRRPNRLYLTGEGYRRRVCCRRRAAPGARPCRPAATLRPAGAPQAYASCIRAHRATARCDRRNGGAVALLSSQLVQISAAPVAAMSAVNTTAISTCSGTRAAGVADGLSAGSGAPAVAAGLSETGITGIQIQAHMVCRYMDALGNALPGSRCQEAPSDKTTGLATIRPCGRRLSGMPRKRG